MSVSLSAEMSRRALSTLWRCRVSIALPGWAKPSWLASSCLCPRPPTDRLDRVTLGSHGVDEPHDQRLRGSSSPTKKVVAARRISTSSRRLPVLGLQSLDLGQLLGGRTVAFSAVDLGLDHPPAHRLLADTELLARSRRSRQRRILPEGRRPAAQRGPSTLHRSSWAWCSSFQLRKMRHQTWGASPSHGRNS